MELLDYEKATWRACVLAVLRAGELPRHQLEVGVSRVVCLSRGFC